MPLDAPWGGLIATALAARVTTVARQQSRGWGYEHGGFARSGRDERRAPGPHRSGHAVLRRRARLRRSQRVARPPRTDGVLGPVRPAGQGGGEAGHGRHDLPHLLDDEAGRQHRPHDAVRRGTGAAHRSGRQVHPRVRRHQGAGGGWIAGGPDPPRRRARPADTHQRPDVRLHAGLAGRRAVPGCPVDQRRRRARSRA